MWVIRDTVGGVIWNPLVNNWAGPPENLPEPPTLDGMVAMLDAGDIDDAGRILEVVWYKLSAMP